MNPFEILEVPADATPDDIRTAYHRLAKLWHPDRFMGEEKAKAEEKFRLVADAFNQLKDPVKRQTFAASAPRPGTPLAKAGTPVAPPSPRTTGGMQIERKPEDWAADAKKAMEAGNLDQARGLIQYAIRLDGSKAEFHIQLADLLDGLGDTRGAIRALEVVQKLRPKDGEILIRLADHFGSLGMQARQTRLLEEAKAIVPNHKRFKTAAEGKVQGTTPQADEGLLGQFKGLLNKLLKKG